MKNKIRNLFFGLVPLFFFSGPGLAQELYVCPMKCDNARTFASPGKCAKCGMTLEKTSTKEKKKSQLHSDDFRLEFRSEPVSIEAGKSAMLILTPKVTKDNSAPKLEIVHEKIMHVILVSKDLSWFDHIHPEQKEDGSLQTPAIFPTGGEYVLYADFTPNGFHNQIFPVAISVQGKERPASSLSKPKLKKKLANYEIALSTEPRLAPNKEIALKFNITSQGKKVTDLEPLLGAKGHCVIVSQDTKDYLHSHPAEHAMTSSPKESHGSHQMPNANSPDSSSESLLFHTRFPRKSLYKVWLQFKHRGVIQTADFVVRVP